MRKPSTPVRRRSGRQRELDLGNLGPGLGLKLAVPLLEVGHPVEPDRHELAREVGAHELLDLSGRPGLVLAVVDAGSVDGGAASFLSEEFTWSEMQRAYEIVLARPLDQSSFRRKVMSLDILEAAGKADPQPDRKRPSTLYRLKDGVGTFDLTLGQSLG